MVLVLLSMSVYVFGQADSYKKIARAYIISQDFVKAKLNHPKDAKFYSDVVHEPGSYGSCVVLGKVDAKNSYGITTRYVYKIWLLHNGKEWTDKQNWSFTKLIIENAANKKQEVFYE